MVVLLSINFFTSILSPIVSVVVISIVCEPVAQAESEWLAVLTIKDVPVII